MAALKILLVRVSSLGDVLHNLPMVADILRHHPEATIDWVVEEGYVSLVRRNPHVRRIFPWALRRWRKSLGKAETRREIGAFFRTLREEQYDYVFDTQGLLKTGIIMGAARVKRGGAKVGLANGSEGSGYEGISRIFHTRSIPLDPRTHAVARGRLVAAAALGYTLDAPPDFGLPAPQGGHAAWMPEQPYAVFFHGTARDAKKWAPANWIATGLALAPMPILLPWGSPGEKQEAELLAASIPNARVLPKLPMDEAVELARHAALAIGVDTGLTHIAAAFVRPTVEIYCDSPKWKTEGNWSNRIVNLGEQGAPPSAEEVIDAARRLLGMNRTLYSLLWWIGMPLVLGRLWWRGRKEPGYRRHWRERLGFYGARTASAHTLWVHAVSVGETRAAEPLIEALLAACPDNRIVLTCMTPTGRATGQALFGKHGARLVQAYLPYDTPSMVRRFLRHFEPRICILMETEVWPNLIAVCEGRVPVALVNARLSERSLRRGQRVGRLMQDAARAVPLVAAQTGEDATRIRSLGAPNVHVTGSIKFDVAVPPAMLELGAWMREHIGARPVLLCASTREGEEALLLDAFQAAQLPPDLLLLVVPRHPQRFEEVAQLFAARGLTVQRRSQLAGPVTSQVLIGDSMGEMFAYYAACDVAFIGGSLLPLGGQNLIEASALGKPVLIGPHTFNFAQVSEEAIRAGAALCVATAPDLFREAARLLEDHDIRAQMGERGVVFTGHHRGATARTVGLVRPLIR